MPIEITGGQQVRRGGAFQSRTAQAASTSTATVGLTPNVDVFDFTGPTDAITNHYTLDNGTEGQEILLVYGTTGTGGGSTGSGGDVQVVPTGTATGAAMRNRDGVTFRQVGQFCRLKFMDSLWHTMERTTFEQHRSTGTDIVLPLTVDSAMLVRSTGTDALYTLADGFEGQRYMLRAAAGTAIRSVTPANMFGYTAVRMDQTATQGGVGVWAEMQFMGGNWFLMSGANLTATSVSFIADTIVT